MTQRQFYAAQRQVAHTVRALDEVLVYEFSGLFLLAFENQAAHLRQCLQRLTAVIAVRFATPKGLLIELNLLSVGAAIHHGTHV